jgi:hypothetical protein
LLALIRENTPWQQTACDRISLAESLAHPLASIDPTLYSSNFHHIELTTDEGNPVTVIGVRHENCLFAFYSSYLQHEILDHDVLLLERPTDVTPNGDFTPPANDYFGSIAVWAAPQKPVYYIDSRSPEQLQIQRNHGVLAVICLYLLVILIGTGVGWRMIFWVTALTLILGVTSFPSPIERSIESVGLRLDDAYTMLRLADWSNSVDGFNIAVQDRLKSLHAGPGIRILVILGDAHAPAMALERTSFARVKRSIIDFIYGPEAPIAQITAGLPGVIHMTPVSEPLAIPTTNSANQPVTENRG